jgi:multidrug efflux pump subunit AcrA (membrane-fusion protein)
VRGRWLLFGGAVIIVAIGAGAFTLLRHRGAASSVTTAGAPASAQTDGSTLLLPGRIEAMEVVAVPVPFDGRIQSLPVNVGQDVVEGDLLAEIRSSDLLSQREISTAELNRLNNRVSTLESNLIAARLEAARAREAAGAARNAVEDARKALQRQQMLYTKGAAARQTLERTQAAVDSATETYEALQKLANMAETRVGELNRDLEAQQQAATEKSRELEDATDQVASGDVRSPVDGYVVARKGQVGDEVTIEVQDLFQIAVNVAQLKVVLEPPPPALAVIRAGQDAIIQIAELSDPIESKVTEVRDGQVTIEFTSPNPVLKPGMTAQVVVKLK